MTGHDDFNRTLAGWMEADALRPAPTGGLNRALDATRGRRPLPAWLAGPGSHWVGEAPHAGSSLVLRPLSRLGMRWPTALILLLTIAALVAGTILVGARLLEHSPLRTDRLGHLAYGLDGDIYVADWDGRNPVRIADGLPGGKSGCGLAGYWAEGPMWSPDARFLAYRSPRSQVQCDRPEADTIPTVRISDPAGHVVAEFPGVGWRVAWSLDSTRVATWVDLDKTIGIYGLDGVRQALLTVPSGCARAGDHDPVWSPDGRSLVISPCEVPLDGRTPRVLPASDPRSHDEWAYSPDGTRVAYIDRGQLIVAAADGSQDRMLVSWDQGLSLVWSPTGDRIAFDSGRYSEPKELRVVDVASGAVTSLASAPGTYSLRVIKFSPEGDRVLYEVSSGTTVGPTSGWSVRADGSDAQLLVAGTGWGDFDWQAVPAGP